MITAKRCELNPLICPEDVKPSREDFKIDGIFNCGAVKYEGETILLCRVAESAKNDDEGRVIIPVIRRKNESAVIETVQIIKKEHPEYDFSDSRSVWVTKNGGRRILYLTSLSHFRVARSKDGVHFTISETPDVFPEALEGWGIEDPRITKIDDMFYIVYTSVSENGAAVGLMVTRDFVSFERKGIIFVPENKDVAIFPEKINGLYYALNRPVPYAIGTPDIWIARSPDLLHWGEQTHFLGTGSEKDWYGGRIGGGAVPVKTEAGWLVIYHAADEKNRYCLGAMLLDLEQPEKMLANLSSPILSPEEDYENEGFFGGVVFTCGVITEGDALAVYYGAADDKICKADFSICELLEELKKEIVQSN